MKLYFLGTGTSQGIPVIGSTHFVCLSDDAKDKRLRVAVWIHDEDFSVVIDCGPDFRQQMLNHQVKSLRAVIFTHEHKDHLAGLDDVRAFNYKEQRDMEVFCTEAVEIALRREFQYVFSNDRYPGIPSIQINRIENKAFELPNGLTLLPIEVLHYKMPVFGYRIGDFTYITDAKTISETEKQKVKGTKILIVNALHRSEHISHFNLDEALAFITEIKPEKAYLTHISHLFGKHQEIEKELPPNVFLAYDGMTLEI